MHLLGHFALIPATLQCPFDICIRCSLSRPGEYERRQVYCRSCDARIIIIENTFALPMSNSKNCASFVRETTVRVLRWYNWNVLKEMFLRGNALLLRVICMKMIRDVKKKNRYNMLFHSREREEKRKREKHISSAMEIVLHRRIKPSLVENLVLSIKSTSPSVACRFCIERMIEYPAPERASERARANAPQPPPARWRLSVTARTALAYSSLFSSNPSHCANVFLLSRHSRHPTFQSGPFSVRPPARSFRETHDRSI